MMMAEALGETKKPTTVPSRAPVVQRFGGLSFPPATSSDSNGATELRAEPIQAAVDVSDPGDPFEMEAGRIADQIMGPPVGSRLDRDASGQPGGSGSVGERVSNRGTSLTPGGSGMPIPAPLRRFYEARFGHDFSEVRIHADDAAAASARSLGALAYTLGADIAFGEGRYEPATEPGRRLLAHELTHVIQQGHGRPASADGVVPPGGRAAGVVQRLIRTPYPWQGVITPAIGANVRSAPDSSDPSNILDSIPRGQPVTVLSASGNWLEVESSWRGPKLVGYVHHLLVDDAASQAMGATVGTTMKWRASGPGSGTDFEAWASAPTETPFPAITSSTIMNCWEAVLLAAFRAGSINWAWIHNLYTAVPIATWVSAMSRGARQVYAVPGPNLRMPQRGDLVFFDGIAHVAMATGTGSDVYTFWPPPNTPFTFVAGGVTDKVKVFKIEALVTWWTANMPPAPVVEFAAPAW
jgi:hypothetical protein